MPDQTSPATVPIERHVGRKIVKCRACEADIMFVITPGNKNMPVNATPIRLVVLDDEQKHIKGYVTGYMPHHATCPKAHEFRGPQNRK